MQALEEQPETIHPLPRKFRYLLSTLVVAVLLVLVYFDPVIRHKRKSIGSLSSMLFISTPRGVILDTVLPDGTRVWLNADSELRFPSDLGSGDRTVELSGEAFFDVGHSAGHPFQVRFKDAVLTVLGTCFNVRAYPEDPLPTTTVSEGAVKIAYLTKEEILKPSQQAILHTTSISGPVVEIRSGVESENLTGWKKGCLQFHDEDLPAIMRALSRAYNINIRLEGPIPVGTFSGAFNTRLPVLQILENLRFNQTGLRMVNADPGQLVITAE